MTGGFGGNILHVNLGTVEFSNGTLFVTCMV